MLRKVTNIFISILILVTTSGFTISKHYCGENLVSISINKTVESCCGDKMRKCCHDEKKHYQLQEDFISSFIHFDFQNDFSIDHELIQNRLFNIHVREDKINDFIVFTDSSPPPELKIALAKLQTYLL